MQLLGLKQTTKRNQTQQRHMWKPGCVCPHLEEQTEIWAPVLAQGGVGADLSGDYASPGDRKWCLHHDVF